MWDAVLAAGQPFGLTPYGTESMHVLRAEKGFVIVGQDTDGTVTPHDLGMSWIVRTDDSDFIGRRSLRRADTVRPDRKQLVGLLPSDPDVCCPRARRSSRPSTRPGHPWRCRPRDLELPEPHARAHVRARDDGRRTRTDRRTVVSPHPAGTWRPSCQPVFWDPEGARRDG